MFEKKNMCQGVSNNSPEAINNMKIHVIGVEKTYVPKKG